MNARLEVTHVVDQQDGEMQAQMRLRNIGTDVLEIWDGNRFNRLLTGDELVISSPLRVTFS